MTNVNNISENEGCIDDKFSDSDENETDEDYSDDIDFTRGEPPTKRARLQKVSALCKSKGTVMKSNPSCFPPMPVSGSQVPSNTLVSSIDGSRMKPFSPGPIIFTPEYFDAITTPSSNSKSDYDPQLTACKEYCDDEMSGVAGFGSHEHHSWKFLIDRVDKNGNAVGHPDFDSRTLHIPQSVLQQQTPAMRQWFEIKSDNYDTILFFKVSM